MLTKCHCLQPLHEHAGEPDDGVERPASDSSTRFTWTSHSGCRTATLRALVDKREACHADVHDDDAHPAVELTTVSYGSAMQASAIMAADGSSSHGRRAIGRDGLCARHRLRPRAENTRFVTSKGVTVV